MRTIILGGGISGIAAAVRLMQVGAKVTLLEARPYLGGRLYSHGTPSFPTPFDCGPHLFLSSYSHTRQLLRDLGIGAPLEFPYPGRIPFRRADGACGGLREFPLPAPINLVGGLLSFQLLSRAARWRTFQTARLLLSEASSPAQSAADYLAQHSQPEENHIFWQPLIRAALNAAPDQVSLKYLQAVFKEGFCQGFFGGRLGYAIEPLGEIFSVRMLRTIEKMGVEVRLKTHVTGLQIDHASVTGVSLKNGTTLPCDAVIAALPPWALLSLASSTPALAEVLAPYCLNEWKANSISSIYLWAKNRPLLELYTCLPGRRAGWVFDFARLWGDYRAPLCLMLENVPDFSRSPDQLRQIMQEVFEAFPQLSSVRWTAYKQITERRATPLRPRSLWSKTLPLHTAISNLFLCGDWLDPDLPPTVEAAVRAGEKAAKQGLGIRG